MPRTPRQVPVIDSCLAGHLVQTRPSVPADSWADTEAAWRDYLAHDNHGRGVVLIGHSQGAYVLKHLVKTVIDRDPARLLEANLRDVEPDPAKLSLGMKVALTTYSLGADSAGTEAIGFGFEPVADGARIVIVVENSPAARAGLKVGMVVTRLNGVPLGALDIVRLKEMFVAAPDDVTLVVTPLGWIKLHREAVPNQ